VCVVVGGGGATAQQVLRAAGDVLAAWCCMSGSGPPWPWPVAVACWPWQASWPAGLTTYYGRKTEIGLRSAPSVVLVAVVVCCVCCLLHALRTLKCRTPSGRSADPIAPPVGPRAMTSHHPPSPFAIRLGLTYQHPDTATPPYPPTPPPPHPYFCWPLWRQVPSSQLFRVARA
jgi:hypothetical protein